MSSIILVDHFYVCNIDYVSPNISTYYKMDLDTLEPEYLSYWIEENNETDETDEIDGD